MTLPTPVTDEIERRALEVSAFDGELRVSSVQILDVIAELRVLRGGTTPQLDNAETKCLQVHPSDFRWPAATILAIIQDLKTRRGGGGNLRGNGRFR